MFINYKTEKYVVAHLNLSTASFKYIHVYMLLHLFQAYNV